MVYGKMLPPWLAPAIVAVILWPCGGSSEFATAAPLPTPTISHLASNDVDGDNRWENEIGATGTAFDWVMSSAQSPATGIDAPFTSFTAAYQYPAAVGTSSSYAAYQSGDATFEMWFRPGNLTGGHVLYENGGTASAAFSLDENVVRFGARRSTTISMITEATLSPAATERFQQIVGVIQIGGGAGQIDLYLNGELIDTDTVGTGFSLWTGIDISGIGSPGGSSLFAGDAQLSSSPIDFDGEIAAFNFYNSALDAGQVAEAYNNFFDPPPIPEPATGLLLGLGLLVVRPFRGDRKK